jgi:transposase
MANLEKKVIGVDVSSKILTFSYLNDENQSVTVNIGNNKTDIQRTLKKLKPTLYNVVVEATGSYSSKILFYSYSLGFQVFMINPLSIKRYGEVKNKISKTDEEDARLIRDYGEKMEMSAYVPKTENLEKLDQEMNLWQDLEMEKSRMALKLKALRHKAQVSKDVVKHYETILKYLEKEILKVQKRIPALEDGEIKTKRRLLTSIKGIGDKTARLLLIATNNFNNFANDKALSKYFGVAPRLYHSGNKKISLGKCRTSKSFVRSVLYVCSWSAVKWNPQCKSLYERLVEKGKSKKLALIAVCNKLLRQAFGVIKNEIKYQADFAK